MVAYEAFHIWHAAIAYFDVVFVEELVERMARGKCLAISRRKIPPTFVETDLLKGGLNHTMFLRLRLLAGLAPFFVGVS